MSKFNVGDKVRCLGKHHNIYPDFYPENGTVGEIIREVPNNNTQAYKVRWKAGSTSGDDRWWAYNDDIELVPAASAQKIVITTDGVTTTATLREGKRVIRTASAKCDPRDTFGYETGAKLAFNRLFTEVTEASPEPPKPKYYTGKVVCVKSGYPWWTVGKVYNIVNGTITANDGDKYRGYISAEDARHAGRRTNSEPFPGSDAGHNPDNEFIPFVEG